jgi:hypothetical protein
MSTITLLYCSGIANATAGVAAFFYVHCYCNYNRMNRTQLPLTAVGASLQRLMITVGLSCFGLPVPLRELHSGSTVVTAATSLTADLLTVVGAVAVERNG